MEALHVKGEDIGYMLISPTNRAGTFYQSLRGHISGALKGAQLVATINRYSQGLERMVRERTQSLSKLNYELKNEISRREEAEKELLKQKNLESLGLLAGGIAHDFNNILTAISGSLSLLALDDEDPAHRRSLYDGMMKAMENARHLTHQLLAFAKGGAPVRKTTSILPLVRETAQFMLHGSNVKAAFHFAETVPNAEIDAGQISQVINNITLNAVQAMPDGGTITYSVDPVVIVQGSSSPEMNPGLAVRIAIADTGSGIPLADVDRVFDPYFTTKETGSGLGLSTALAIVRKHGGDITVSSIRGKGSVFGVYLPASEGETAPVEVPSPTHIPAGLRVLVLDDDSQVQQIMTAFLKRTGEDTTVTADGSEAVSLYESALESGARFDLLIMDLTIPGGMGGSEAFARIRALDPQARAIVTSGYSDVPILAEYRRYGFRGILRKPFTFEDFRAAIAEALS